MIYLDNAATSFPKPDQAVQAIGDFFKQQIATVNRRGYHSVNHAEMIMDETRENLLNFIGARNQDKLVFTLNSTEAINMAIRGVLNQGDHVITSTFEHSAVSRTLTALSVDKDITFSKVSPDSSGKITTDIIQQHIKPNTKLIALCHGSNVTGNILPDPSIGTLAKEKNILYFLDASQSIGSYPIDVVKDKVDLLAFSGHKSLMGPPGVGALYFTESLSIKPYRYGGTGINSENDWFDPRSSSDYETGTPNVLGISGLNASLQFIKKVGLSSVIRHKQALIQRLIHELQCREEITLYGHTEGERRLPILSFNLQGPLTSNELGLLLEKSFSIKTRTGLHCSPWAHKELGTYPSGTVRISIGFFNSDDDISSFVSSLDAVICELKTFS